MQQERRLTGAKRFSSIHREGRRWTNGLLVLKMMPNGLDTSRFGLVVGKKLAGAVGRNRVKRRLREAIRPIPVETGWDVVFIARRMAATAGFHQLRRATENLLTRAGLLSRPASLPPNPTVGEDHSQRRPMGAAQQTSKEGVALPSRYQKAGK